ncbi:MAG: hypothetical protein V4635_02420 [Bacteroidota bacterium]
MLFKNFICILLSAFFSTGCSLVLEKFAGHPSPYWPFSILYFLVLSFIMNLFYAYKSASPDFTQLLLGGIVIKLLLSLVVILVFSVRKPIFFNFSLHFISHYVLFTIFEIRYLLPLIRKNTPNEK